jgi:hypothetical protein
MVGNGMWIQGGTGSLTADYYQITGFTNSTTINVDKSPAAGTGASWNVGGAIKNIITLAAKMIGSNKAFVKAEATITTTATLTFVAAAVTPSATVPSTHLIGYTTTRGDGGQVSLTLSTNTGITAMKFSAGGWTVEGFNINCSSLATSIGVDWNSGNLNILRNCKIANFASMGIKYQLSSSLEVSFCEITGGTGGTGAIDGNSSSGLTLIGNWIHDNACPGVGVNPIGSKIIGNVISNNSGGSSDGLAINGGAASGFAVIWGNSIYKNGRHGILFSSGIPPFMRNNIITDHTAGSAAGIKCSTAALPADPRYDGNFFYNNTIDRVNLDDYGTSTSSGAYSATLSSGIVVSGSNTNAVNVATPYVSAFDVKLTATPWNNAGSNDFTLNTTAGGGAAVRGKGQPGVGGTLFSGIPGLTTLNGYLDGGVFQHQDPAGGSGPPNQVTGARSIGTY